jgi:hypothetical protein
MMKVVNITKGDMNMTESDVDFKLEIKDLRIAVERALDKLKNFEMTGTEQDANSALWTVSAIWNGREYSTIEAALKVNGYKTSLERSMKKGE